MQLGEICKPDAILCTNTSSMSIGEITKDCKNPERCIGMHFFFPVYAMKLVEMIRSCYTSDATVAAVREVAEKMGKKPVECKTDTPGFIVNRCLFAFMLEAIHCYEDGVATVDGINTAIKFGLEPSSRALRDDGYVRPGHLPSCHRDHGGPACDHLEVPRVRQEAGC